MKDKNMKSRTQNDSSKTASPVNLNTSFLITLATLGAAASGMIELFAFHPDSEMTEVVLRTVGLVAFGIAGYFAVRRVRSLQQQVVRELIHRDRALEQLRSTEDYNRLVVENGQGLMCVHDLRGVLLSVNRAASEALGYSEQELIRRNLRDLVPDALRKDFDNYLARIRGAGKDSNCMIVRSKRGELMTWAYRNAIFTQANGQRLVVGSAQDITDKVRRKAAEKQVREQLEIANIRLQEQTSRLRNYNQQLAQLHSLTQAMQSGKTVVEAMSLALGPLQELFVGCAIGIYVKNPSTEVFSKAAEAGRLQMKSVLSPSECSSLRDGLIRAIDPNCSTCLYSSRSGRFKGKAYAIPLRDEDETIGLLVVENRSGQMPDEEILQSTSDHLKTTLTNKLLQQKLTEQSTRDSLTGLLNRRFMEETLRATVARAKRTGEPLAVVMLDIDHFKRLNDTFGHQVGDEALRVVSRIIQKSVRAEDVACRYGGEEFMLIMPGATLAVATARAESLRRSISQVDLNHVALGIKGITVSAGVAPYSARTLNEVTLIAAADEALYTAKKTGRNRVVKYGDTVFDSLHDVARPAPALLN
jgi:diguanylate cyclase (GGDEF)-like protein/PAS domain S-box-containing protein